MTAERNQQIMALYHEGLKLREIARRLNITVSVVSGVLHRSGEQNRGGRRLPARHPSKWRFGRWVVISHKTGRTDNFGTPLWECRCDCGTVKFIQGSNLERGHSTQCRSCANKASALRRAAQRSIEEAKRSVADDEAASREVLA